MRMIQMILLALGVVSLIVAAFGIGKDFGETFYNTGIAVLLVDVVCLQLWPSEKRL